MIDRVHRNAAHLGPFAKPSVTTGLTDGDILVLDIADLSDGRDVHGQDLANFARRQPEQRVLVFLGDDLGISAGGADQLAAATGIELNVVHQGAKGNAGQRQCTPPPPSGLAASLRRRSARSATDGYAGPRGRRRLLRRLRLPSAVRAPVAQGVEVVVDAHDRDAVTLDVKAL